MDTHQKPYIIIVVPQSQLKLLYLLVNRQKHLVNHFDIVFIQANNNECLFHVLDNLSDTRTRVLPVRRNLGSFINELGSDFLRPNQSFLINRYYIDHITAEDYVKLRYPNKHPDIHISRGCKKKFYEGLDSAAAA